VLSAAAILALIAAVVFKWASRQSSVID
jgi:hypothetical protein